MTDTANKIELSDGNALDDKSLESLKERLRGPVSFPGDRSYEQACSIWNGMIEKRPAIVVQPTGAADVIECVNFAREGNVPISVRGGGHNIAGTAIAEGGLLIDHTPRKGVWVDRSRNIIRIEPGANWGDADRETQLYGLVVPGGIVSHTGVAGFTLGGGFGWASRKYGLASDKLLSVELVTAKGELLCSSEAENPDLFWAIRGGGGNFGIVTSFEFKACPLGPQVVAGMVLYPLEMARQVISLFRTLTASASDEFCCLLVIRRAPPAPFLPQEIHGKPVIGIVPCHIGSIADGEKAVQPIKDLDGALVDMIAAKPFTAHQSMLDAGQPFGRRYYWKSDYFSSFDPAMDEIFIKYGDAIKSPHSAMLMMHLGGQTNRIGETDTAAGNRDAEFIINIQSQWEDDTEDDIQISWCRDFWSALRPFGTGGTYVNFLTEDEDVDRVQEAYRSNIYSRLVEVKTKYDPGNMFRSNQNIAPNF